MAFPTPSPPGSLSRPRSQTPRRRLSQSRSLSPLSDRSPQASPRYSRYSSPSRDDRHDDRHRHSPSRERSLSPVQSTKIVVEKLTKNVNEDHLYEIFGQFGHIKDLDLPISRISGTNRGTAYILYKDEMDAESAISHMHEGQLDGATINVSIVLPRQSFVSPPPTARRGANFNPRNAPAASRSSRRSRRSPNRFGSTRGPDIYRPASRSRSRSRTPPLENHERQRSRPARSDESRSLSPPPNRSRRDDRGTRRRRVPDADFSQDNGVLGEKDGRDSYHQRISRSVSRGADS